MNLREKVASLFKTEKQMIRDLASDLLHKSGAESAYILKCYGITKYEFSLDYQSLVVETFKGLKYRIQYR